MIIEDLENEIASRANDAVIQYVANFLSCDETWFDIEDLDIDAKTLAYQYVRHLRLYVNAKLIHHKIKRQDCLYISEEELSKYEHSWKYLKVEKNKTRQKLIDIGVDYKKYHK